MYIKIPEYIYCIHVRHQRKLQFSTTAYSQNASNYVLHSSSSSVLSVFAYQHICAAVRQTFRTDGSHTWARPHAQCTPTDHNVARTYNIKSSPVVLYDVFFSQLMIMLHNYSLGRIRHGGHAVGTLHMCVNLLQQRIGGRANVACFVIEVLHTYKTHIYICAIARM